MDGAAPVLDMALQVALEGETSDAEALVRFALSSDPESARAHVILARLRARRGELEIAVDELVESARRLASEPCEDPQHLYSMFAAALELDPVRIELHVDLAQIQAAHDDVGGGQARLVQLSAIYIDAGRHEDARAVLAVASAWDPQSTVAGVIETQLPLEESIPILLEEVVEDNVHQPAPAPTRQPAAQTICTPTLLRDAGGSVLPNQDAVPPPALSRRRRPVNATICTPTLLRDAHGIVVPNQAGIPKPATGRTRSGKSRVRVPAPPIDRPSQRPSTGRSRTIPKPRTSIRTLRARAQVRKQADTSAAEARLASRLRKLGGLPRNDPRD